MDLLAPILTLETREDETFTVVVPVFLTPMHLAKDGCKLLVVLGGKTKMFRIWVTRFKISNDVIQECEFLTLGGDKNET